VRDAFCQLQGDPRVGGPELGARFRAQICKQFTPCFHRWFLSSFPEPASWLEARTTCVVVRTDMCTLHTAERKLFPGSLMCLRRTFPGTSICAYSRESVCK